jgi:hypothetical protein
MQEKFGAPVEQKRFARIEFGRALVLANGFERIVEFLGSISHRMMNVRIARLDLGCAPQIRNGFVGPLILQ